jgi:hypothetical protein
VRDALAACGEALWLFTPIFLAAAVNGTVMKLDILNALKRPMDGGLTWRGRRIFGDNKTWRTAFVGTASCAVGVVLQAALVGTTSFSVVDYDALAAGGALLGAAMGAGAIVGELPNSFLKRQLDIGPGRPGGAFFWVLDQIDLLILTWPLLLFWVDPHWMVVAASFVLGAGLHPLISLLGWLAGARKTAR